MVREARGLHHLEWLHDKVRHRYLFSGDWSILVSDMSQRGQDQQWFRGPREEQPPWRAWPRCWCSQQNGKPFTRRNVAKSGTWKVKNPCITEAESLIRTFFKVRISDSESQKGVPVTVVPGSPYNGRISQTYLQMCCRGKILTVSLPFPLDPPSKEDKEKGDDKCPERQEQQCQTWSSVNRTGIETVL